MKRKDFAVLIFILGFVLTLIVSAGKVDAQAPTPTPAPATSPGPSPTVVAARPKVTGVVGHLELDEIVGVEVEHFSEWAATHDATKLVPFVNGRAVSSFRKRNSTPKVVHSRLVKLISYAGFVVSHSNQLAKHHDYSRHIANHQTYFCTYA